MRHGLTAVPTALTAALLLAVPASAAAPSPGAPGAGDAYYPDYGNGGYDVSHYDLRLRYQPKTDHLKGTATLLATATQDLSRFNLDFALDVEEVRVNGRAAHFAATGDHELEVTPARPVAEGEQLTVVVRYAGVPSKVKVDGVTAWHRTKDGGIAANEPEAAWWWYPSNDHPTDKATYDINVFVPDGTQAISNGRFLGERSSGGWTRSSWRATAPQATYLTTLAMGRFDIVEDEARRGLPVLNAYSKDLGELDKAARASVERTAEVTAWLEKYLGRYPFDALGGYVPNTETGFALETQTRPFYSPAQFASGANVSVIVHELAHQWYGDSVSVSRWQDIWLNEGFAAYTEWLWSEDQGEGTARELAAYAYDSHEADDDFWKVEPGDPGPKNQFHDAVYDRGAMAVQALRQEIGDKAFFAVLKGWPQERGGGDATVQDFRRYAERVSGKDLRGLFRTWLHTPSKPKGAPFAEQGRAAQQPESWRRLHATERHGH
ncbi:M1 family metallopeptidase [Streptomyces sulphureus]|uniref:M1 family metallopeptidase n=1 Tax=Streptomyces sulphureus TaxID=47758 RepID=UPI000371EE7F|nr:M1 family metallopeptidase [Streptomyces sulphureus]